MKSLQERKKSIVVVEEIVTRKEILAVMGDESLYSYTEEGTNTVDYYGGESFDTSATGNNQYRVYINDDNKGDVVRVLDDALVAGRPRGH